MKNKKLLHGLAAIVIWLATTSILFNTVWQTKPVSPGFNYHDTSLFWHTGFRVAWIIISICITVIYLICHRYHKTYDESYFKRRLRGETQSSMLTDIAVGEKEKQHEIDERRYQAKAMEAPDHCAEGLIFGRIKPSKGSAVVYSPASVAKHALAIAATGGGKTSAFLRPTINHWPQDGQGGTVWAIDISGDISSQVNRPGAIIFDPTNPKSNVRYDLFAPIYSLDDFDMQLMEIDNLASVLIPVHDGQNEAGRYYETMANTFVKASILDALNRRCSLPEALKTAAKEDVEDYTEGLIERDKTGEMQQIVGTLAKENEGNINGAKNKMITELGILINNPIISKAFMPEKKTVNIDYNTAENQSVFIKIPQKDLGSLKSILGLLASQVCKNLIPSRSLDSKSELLICLDELPAYYIDDFQTTLATARKYHATICACCQSFSQLDAVYGKPTRLSLINNFAYTVVMGTREPDTARYLSDMIGTEKHLNKGIHYGSDASTMYNESWIEEPIIKPDEFLHMPADRLVLISPEGYEWLYRNFDFKYYKSLDNNIR